VEGVIVVATREALRDVARELGGVSGIGVDTESDSFHSYREKTCLIQISTRDADFIIDPLALDDVSPLAAVFADPAVQKVFHAAENDVANLRRDFGIRTRSLFDTRAAARILGVKQAGLADLLRLHFGVEANKRMQRYPWGTRPLDAAALEYAAADSHFLLPLRDILYRQLVERGHVEEAEEEAARLECVTAAARAFDPETFWRIKGAISLAPQQRATLRELYIWRDHQAAAANRPPFRIAPDSALVAVAEGLPEEMDALRRLDGVPPTLVDRYAFGLLGAVRRGLRAEPPRPPRRPRPDDQVLNRYEALRAWRRQVAVERGVEHDVVISNASLQALAERNPADESELASVSLIGPWRLRTYGKDLLGVLKRTDLSESEVRG
jgi:ribonuclease D